MAATNKNANATANNAAAALAAAPTSTSTSAAAPVAVAKKAKNTKLPGAAAPVAVAKKAKNTKLPGAVNITAPGVALQKHANLQAVYNGLLQANVPVTQQFCNAHAQSASILLAPFNNSLVHVRIAGAGKTGQISCAIKLAKGASEGKGGQAVAVAAGKFSSYAQLAQHQFTGVNGTQATLTQILAMQPAQLAAFVGGPVGGPNA